MQLNKIGFGPQLARLLFFLLIPNSVSIALLSVILLVSERRDNTIGNEVAVLNTVDGVTVINKIRINCNFLYLQYAEGK